MNVEQIFYGRGADGYAILGSSVPSCGLTDQVLELCQSVGTPGFEREDDNQPFLLQKVCGANVLMVCGRNGEPDSFGRKTLFFHAVVVPLAYAKEQKLSAADLYRADVFSTKCRDGTLSALVIDHVKGASDSHSCGFKFPAAFSCRRANNLALVKLLDGKLVGANWATMCWRLMAGFDWFGLDASRLGSDVTAEYSVYDTDGKLLGDVVEEDGGSEPGGGDCGRSIQSKPQKKNGGNMKMSLVFGIVGALLGLGLGWCIWGGAKPTTTKDASILPQTEIKADDREELVAEIEALKAKMQAEKARLVFDESYYIPNFEAAMAKDKAYEVNVKGKNKDAPEGKPFRDLFNKLEAYVRFVNTNFCNQTSK